MSEKKEYSGFLSWGNIRDFLAICFIVIVTWKLLNSEIQVRIEELAFSDLLSIFLAFFAISLSVAFYFKATETSNKFYDNSYKFTKEISEILGRIEAGFGEKLKHIDEGYTGIRDKFDRLPFDAVTANEEVEAEKKEIDKKQKEQEALLEELAQRAKLAESEKNELFQKMARTTRELDTAKNDLRRMQKNIKEHETFTFSHSARKKVLDYLAERINEELPLGMEDRLTMSLIREIFSKIRDGLHPEAMEDLLNSGLITSDGELSQNGLQYIRMRLRKSLE